MFPDWRQRGEIITLRGAIALKLFDDRDGQYKVITDRPLSILTVPERIWGNESVRLSGAFVFPDSAASIATPHLYHGIEQVQNPKTETRPAEAHRCLYREVNYTEELKDEIARVRGVKLKAISGNPNPRLLRREDHNATRYNAENTDSEKITIQDIAAVSP